MGLSIRLYVVAEQPRNDNVGKFVQDKNLKWVECFDSNMGRYYPTKVGGKPTRAWVDKNDEIIERIWCRPVAYFELGWLGLDFGKKDAEYFFYDTDNNTPVIVGRGDTFLKQRNIQEVIAELAYLDGGHLSWALGSLEAIEKQYPQAQVLLYGH